MSNSRLRAARFVLLLGLPIALAAAPLPSMHAQASSATIAAWTRTLRTGSLQARADALANLTRGPVSALPSATRDALIAELTRLHTAIVAGRPRNSVDEGELFTDYYMELVGAVAEIRTPQAALALVPAVGVSNGVARRVARLGDAGVDAVLPLLARGYEASSMLETLGFAWFWADSTHAPLSDRSRARIASAFITAAASDSVESLFGVPRGIRNAADPAFLPLATAMAARVDTVSAEGAIVASTLRSDVIPTLTRLASTRSPADLARGAARAVTALCTPRDENEAGERHQRNDEERGQHGHSETCAAIARDFTSVARALQLGKATGARSDLLALRRRIEQAFSQHRLTTIERDLLAGNVSMLLARLGP